MADALKFLIDNAMSPSLAQRLGKAGFDTVHVRDRSLASADDETIFDLAATEDRVIISQDTDFAALLATRRASKPSVILFRRNTGRTPEVQFELLMKNLPQIEDALREGSVAVFEDNRIRVRALPIARSV